ncbi:MAG: aspartate/glutamate racemase family protein [Chitinophagaceae bacterium]|nr:aspartate/glutamate racemase family protein [Chitinophagaceae bacterium]MBK9568913.1 aspartate/glutamate racemase family protein [Chitinophagaceae bacterium]MBL0273016.1 aspartate/glutamate racemase family protein [Chitinophagaceae bacterium]
MKTIGLVGGLTWYSTIDYYRFMNQQVNERLGGDEAAKIVLNSVNYGEIKKLTQAGDWKGISAIISKAAKMTEAAGADCLLLGANTMHHIAEEVAAVIQIPLIHIADATAKAIKEKKIKTVGLLGTKYTMQFDFYKNKLASHGITTLIPDECGVEDINKSIYEELGKGILLPETKQKFLTIINELIRQGAEGVILGCTEIPLLIKQEDSPVPVFDTTLLHAIAAVDFALGQQ